MNEIITFMMNAFRKQTLICVFGCALASGPLQAAEGLDAEADGILKSMSTYLGGLKAFSVDADIDLEVVTKSGQKLQFSSVATAVLKRPSGFHITRKGMAADAEFIFNGETLTLYGKNLNAYAQVKVPGNTDDAILAYELETGIAAPGADLLFSDPYAVLSRGIQKGDYLGTAYVNGVECHYLVFREGKVDWQLWVQSGDKPLPMKYVITSKWQAAAPQYAIRFRNWDTSLEIPAGQFAFTAPVGAENLGTITVNELGEFVSTEEGR
jgi:hypothetical protein